MKSEDLDEKWNFYPNVCLKMKHWIIFLTKSDLNNYIGKHEYHKNHRKEKYDRVTGWFNHRNNLYSLKFEVFVPIASFWDIMIFPLLSTLVKACAFLHMCFSSQHIPLPKSEVYNH